MKAHELREMTSEELEQHYDVTMDEIVRMRIKLAAKQLDNPLSIRKVRKELARTSTILREKTLGAKPGQTLDDMKKESKA
jgi:large subunit ribosomal protein L29